MEELLKTGLGKAADLRVPRFLIVPKLSLFVFPECRQEIERDVGRLEMTRIGMRDVVAQTAEFRRTGESLRICSQGESRRVSSSNQTRGNGLRIALDPRDLAGKEDAAITFELERRF